MWGLILVTFPIWFYLQLARSGLLLVGSFFALLGGMIILRRWWKGTPAKSVIPELQFHGWKASSALAHSPIATKTVHGLILIVGLVIGYAARDVQTTIHIHEETIHILQDLGNHQYTVECSDPKGCRFEVCNTDPGFDAGDWAWVRYEERDNGRGGRCNSFDDEERTKWKAIPGHAKNREALWTSPQQNPQ